MGMNAISLLPFELKSAAFAPSERTQPSLAGTIRRTGTKSNSVKVWDASD
jgi:hypothetical protein